MNFSENHPQNSSEAPEKRYSYWKLKENYISLWEPCTKNLKQEKEKRKEKKIVSHWENLAPEIWNKKKKQKQKKEKEERTLNSNTILVIL